MKKQDEMTTRKIEEFEFSSSLAQKIEQDKSVEKLISFYEKKEAKLEKDIIETRKDLINLKAFIKRQLKAEMEQNLQKFRSLGKKTQNIKK